MIEDDYRPCICGKLWGLVLEKPHDVSCLCGVTLHVRPEGDGWFVQHGPNPEHRSPRFAGGSLIKVCDWIDAVCLHDRPSPEPVQ